MVAQPRWHNLGNWLPRMGRCLKAKAPVGAGAFWESVLGRTWRGLPDQNNPPRRKAFQNNAKKRSPGAGEHRGLSGGSGKTANSVGASITSLAAGPRWFCDKSHNEGKRAPTEADAPAQVVIWVSEPPNANASIPSRTPAGLADGGSGHADTINSYPARAACFAHLRDHAVRLMKRHGWHSLSRRCSGQGDGGNSDQSDHWFSPMIGDAGTFGAGGRAPAVADASQEMPQRAG